MKKQSRKLDLKKTVIIELNRHGKRSILGGSNRDDGGGVGNHGEIRDLRTKIITIYIIEKI